MRHCHYVSTKFPISSKKHFGEFKTKVRITSSWRSREAENKLTFSCCRVIPTVFAATVSKWTWYSLESCPSFSFRERVDFPEFSRINFDNDSAKVSKHPFLGGKSNEHPHLVILNFESLSAVISSIIVLISWVDKICCPNAGQVACQDNNDKGWINRREDIVASWWLKISSIDKEKNGRFQDLGFHK